MAHSWAFGDVGLVVDGVGRRRNAGRLFDRGADDPVVQALRGAAMLAMTNTATASETLRVLDALLYHQSEVLTGRHHTDGGGDSDHVFPLCSLLGFQFAPRIPDLKHRRLYSFGKPFDYPTLEPMIGGRINLALILCIVASIRIGTVIASVIMRQLAAYLRQSGVAAALCELRRPDRTLFKLDWIEHPELSRSTGQELNKSEFRNSLARAVPSL